MKKLLLLFILFPCLAYADLKGVIQNPNAVLTTGSFTAGDCAKFNNSGSSGARLADSGSPCGGGGGPFVPYTGANASVNLNTQSLYVDTIGGSSDQFPYVEYSDGEGNLAIGDVNEEYSGLAFNISQNNLQFQFVSSGVPVAYVNNDGSATFANGSFTIGSDGTTDISADLNIADLITSQANLELSANNGINQVVTIVGNSISNILDDGGGAMLAKDDLYFGTIYANAAINGGGGNVNIGDVEGSSNGTVLTIDDTATEIRGNANNGYEFSSAQSGFFQDIVSGTGFYLTTEQAYVLSVSGASDTPIMTITGAAANGNALIDIGDPTQSFGIFTFETNQSAGTFSFLGGDVIADQNLHVAGAYYDSAGQPGFDGYILTSNNGTGTVWKSTSSAGLITNPMTTLGDSIYGAASGVPARLAGNTTSTKKYLSQTGTGSASAAQVWAQVAAADISGLAASATIDTTNASNISSGTLAAARLPNPSASTLGGIQSKAAVTSNWINSISTAGVPSATQPAFTDISGTAMTAQLPTGALAGSGGTPTCGAGCASITGGSRDVRGSATSGTLATSVVINFSATLASIPFCTVSGSNASAALGYTASTSALTVSLSTALTGDVITWNCPL